MPKKTCSKCKSPKGEDEFTWRSKPQGVRHGVCRKCRRDGTRRWYEKHRDEQRARVNKYNRRYRQKAREFIYGFLQSHPCVDCGEADPVVLEFDHQDPEKKTLGISKAIAGCWSVKRIAEEIEKCEVRCANCHRRKTAKQLGWWVPETDNARKA